MNVSTLRFRLAKLCPGIDLDLVDGWIGDRYQEILDLLPWKRMEGESIFQILPSYSTGTLSAINGSAAITGSGTAWAYAGDGCIIRIGNTSEYYEFTAVDATDATLDRPFESPTATGLSYRIDQNVIQLPAGCRILRGVRPLHDRDRPLRLVTPGELNRISSYRDVYGTPVWAAQTWDSFSDPPIMQVELFPVPSSPDSTGTTLSFVIDYVYDANDPTVNNDDLLPWVRPSALIAGVTADIRGYERDFKSQEVQEARFQSLVKEMAMINALQRGPQPLRLAPELRRNAPPLYHYGPKHRGFTG